MAKRAAPLGINDVKGLSVTNFKIKPTIKMTEPTIRNVLISNVLGLSVIETTSVAPTTDINDISANTEDKNENRYSDEIAETIIPRRVKSLVDFMIDFSFAPLIFATRTPNAKALESIVPIKDAMSEMVNNGPSHEGNAVRTPLVNKSEGSLIRPENLKFIPR